MLKCEQFLQGGIVCVYIFGIAMIASNDSFTVHIILFMTGVFRK